MAETLERAGDAMRRWLRRVGRRGMTAATTRRARHEERTPVEQPVWLHEFSFPAVLAEIPTARRRVSAQAEACGLTGPALFDLLLAVGEALANAVKHGSPRQGDDVVTVRVGFAVGGGVVVEVRDQGRGFGSSRLTPPEAFAAGGRGIPFMRALVDELRFDFGAEGTSVLLVKRMR